MARFSLKSFAQPDLLKKIQPANLIPLLEPFQIFLEMKGFSLPSGPDQEIVFRCDTAQRSPDDPDAGAARVDHQGTGRGPIHPAGGNGDGFAGIGIELAAFADQRAQVVHRGGHRQKSVGLA